MGKIPGSNQKMGNIKSLEMSLNKNMGAVLYVVQVGKSHAFKSHVFIASQVCSGGSGLSTQKGIERKLFGVAARSHGSFLDQRYQTLFHLQHDLCDCLACVPVFSQKMFSPGSR